VLARGISVLQQRIGLMQVSIVPCGLVMHAFEMHGSAIHLVSAAAVLIAAVRPWIGVPFDHLVDAARQHASPR
jgi:hypothetical protein